MYIAEKREKYVEIFKETEVCSKRL